MDLPTMESNKLQTKNYYEYVYSNNIKSDIEIVVKNKVIQAHKEILGLQNPVFMNKFLSQPNLTKIEIPDLDADAVQIFIDYLYTGKLCDKDISEELFLVADKYSCPTLKNFCREKIKENWNVKTATGRLLVHFNCAEEGSVFIAKNFNDVKMHSDLKQVFENEVATNAIFKAFGKFTLSYLCF